MLKTYLRHPLCHLLFILIIGIVAYANSFKGPFVLDDLETIATNGIIRDLGNFLPGGTGYDYISRRWVGYFTFALNYRFGGLDVTGYHLFNLAVHLCSASLVYALVRLTFRTPKMTGSGLATQSGAVALLAALFFVAHPVQTQAVTYIVQRLTSLCTLFYLLSLVLYAAARLRLDKPSAHGGNRHALAAGGWRGVLLLAGSLVAALLAMYTKEIAFTLPLVILLYESSFFRGPWRRRILFLIPLLLTLPVIPSSVLVMGSGPTLDTGAAELENQFRAHTDMPRLHYLFTQFRVIVTYLRLLFLPVGQNVDYDYPVYSTLFTAPVLLSCLLLAALLLLAIYLYWLSRETVAPSPKLRHELRLVAFGIIWFFLTLAVESSLVPLADVIFEHRLYLPSIGPAISLAVLVGLAVQRAATLKVARLALPAAMLAVVLLTAATWQRNRVWQSEVRLWTDAVRKSPAKARPWYNLGTHLIGTGNAGEALPALQQAVRLDPEHAEAWHNLGRAFLMAGRYMEALQPLRKAVKLDPKLDNAVINLSVALIFTNQPREAVFRLERIRQTLPERADVRYNLGLAYLGLGKLDGARGELAALKLFAPEVAADLAAQISQASAKPASK